MQTSGNSSSLYQLLAFVRIEKLCRSAENDIPQICGLDWAMLFAWAVYASGGNSEAQRCCGGPTQALKYFKDVHGLSEREVRRALLAVSGWTHPKYPFFRENTGIELYARSKILFYGLGVSLCPVARMDLGLFAVPGVHLLFGADRYLGVEHSKLVLSSDLEQLKFLAASLASHMAGTSPQRGVERLAEWFCYRQPALFAEMVMALAEKARQLTRAVDTRGK